MRLRDTMMAGVAALVLGGLALPASAEVANTNVNVRATPGGAIVDVLRAGESATVVGQSGGWCEVQKSGPDGWVACRYLDDDDDAGGPIDDDDDDVVSPDVSVSFSIPGFSFSIGDGGFDFDRPGRPGDRVCFYEHVNYQGRQFCMEPGDRRPTLGAWNDRISSIRVFGDAEAQVCQNNNYRGRCAIVDRNVRNLGVRGNDIISSIRVRGSGAGNPPPPPDDVRDRVCFYEHVNFEGDRFCMRPGETQRSLGSAWNDRISSIRVFGDAEAQVCEHDRFEGRCAVIDSNQRSLGANNNDIISSIRVR